MQRIREEGDGLQNGHVSPWYVGLGQVLSHSNSFILEMEKDTAVGRSYIVGGM